MAVEYAYRCCAYSKSKESLDEFFQIVSENSVEIGVCEEVQLTEELWKFFIVGDVKYSCWKIAENSQEDLDDICKRLGIALEIFGEVSDFVEEGEEIPEEWENKYVEDIPEGKIAYFQTQHIFIWENGGIEEDEFDFGKLDRFEEWEPDENMIEYFSN